MEYYLAGGALLLFALLAYADHRMRKVIEAKRRREELTLDEIMASLEHLKDIGFVEEVWRE